MSDTELVSIKNDILAVAAIMEVIGSEQQTMSPAYAASVSALLGRCHSTIESLSAALGKIIAADDDFRASMSPEAEKDPVTLACDEARSLSSHKRDDK